MNEASGDKQQKLTGPESAQAAGHGVKKKIGSADLAGAGESVVRELFTSAQAAGHGVKKKIGSADLAGAGESAVRDFLKRDSVKRTGSLARSSCFRYYIHDGAVSCRLQLLGELTEAEVPDLNGCWRTAKTTLGSRQLVLDLYALKSVDEAGKQWLAGMAQEGAACLPEGYLRDLVAGKHTAGVEPPRPASKSGLFGRIVNLFRGVGVEAAK